MSHSNISIFVPHIGCPHTCAFCNQRTISGEQNIPHAQDVISACKQAMEQVSDIRNTEIAFFGGSFTAIEKDYMLELLESASQFVGEDKFEGIRISTRPDCIDDEILTLLKRYGVTSIELGAQSMCDDVLDKNERGHTAEDVRKASALIKSYGFELGLQMMIGLYGSNAEKELCTMVEIAKCRPDTVRIYPVAVIEGTKLAELYKFGEYVLADFDEVVKLCGFMLKYFTSKNIRVIRLGLHASDNVAENMVAGFYHPAFAELVRSQLYLDLIEKVYISTDDGMGDVLEVFVSPKDVSAAVGHKKSNKIYFEKHKINVKFSIDDTLLKDEICIKRKVYNVLKIT